MNAKQLIAQEAEQMPEFLLGEVLDFMQFLKQKHRLASFDIGIETAILSESSLKKDWLSEEEDEAWQNL